MYVSMYLSYLCNHTCGFIFIIHKCSISISIYQELDAVPPPRLGSHHQCRPSITTLLIIHIGLVCYKHLCGVCMYVCMYMYVCVYACLYIYIYICMYHHQCRPSITTLLIIHIGLVCYKHLCGVCMYVCMYMYVCVYVCLYIYIYVCIIINAVHPSLLC
jgi:hypothetical protein